MSTQLAGRSTLAATAQQTGPPARRLSAVGRPLPPSRQHRARSHEQDVSNAEAMGAFPGEDAPGTGGTEGSTAASIECGPNCPGDQRVAGNLLAIHGVDWSQLLNGRGAALPVSHRPAGAAKTGRVLRHAVSQRSGRDLRLLPACRVRLGVHLKTRHRIQALLRRGSATVLTNLGHCNNLSQAAPRDTQAEG